MSTFVSYPLALPASPRVSGAIQCGVPIIVPRFDIVLTSCATTPKSASLTRPSAGSEHRITDGGNAGLSKRAAVAKLHDDPQRWTHMVVTHESVLVRNYVLALTLTQDPDFLLNGAGCVVLERQHLDGDLLVVAHANIHRSARTGAEVLGEHGLARVLCLPPLALLLSGAVATLSLLIARRCGASVLDLALRRTTGRNRPGAVRRGSRVPRAPRGERVPGGDRMDGCLVHIIAHQRCHCGAAATLGRRAAQRFRRLRRAW
eukprot:scaffold164083_cov30-Tisochrysis_lutea.AAC.2